MKKFTFRLDKILDYRVYQELAAHKGVIEAKRERSKTERRMASLMKKRMDVSKECSAAGDAGIGVPKYRLYQTFLETLDYDLADAAVLLQRADQQVAEREKTLKQETIQRKMLETLKEMKKTDYFKTSVTQEQRDLDDMVISRKGQIK